MCSTCGCGADEVRVIAVGHTHDGHPHDHDHPPGHDHEHAREHPHPVRQHRPDPPEPPQPEPVPAATTTLTLEQRVLAKNDELAARNRRWLTQRGIRAVNMMSSPGAGKTTLLERTIRDSKGHIAVIEGDQETVLDAERIRAAGARAVQVNTGAGCHLDATMVQQALHTLEPDGDSLVFIENVGNLVCPALFDLGENRRVVIISVTEGEDKPLKYPHMFAAADLVVINKVDLLPYVDFDLARLEDLARQLRPGVEVIGVSARTGENLDSWYRWLHRV